MLFDIDPRGVATVTLNRPTVNNAYNDALIDGFSETFCRLEREPLLRCAMLHGAGRHFQAGADLSFLRHWRTVFPGDNLDFSRRTVAAIEQLRRFPCPILALVHGGCFGGGVGIAAACDIAVAAEEAVLDRGALGDHPGSDHPAVVDWIGSRALRRLSLIGERFGAAAALRIGLVHEICPAAELDVVAGRVVENILMAAPEAVSMTKRLVAEAVEILDTSAFREHVVVEAAARRRLAEAAEGLSSFAEKRTGLVSGAVIRNLQLSPSVASRPGLGGNFQSGLEAGFSFTQRSNFQ